MMPRSLLQPVPIPVFSREIPVDLDPDTTAAVQEYARRERLSFDGVIELAIRDFLRRFAHA